MNRGRRYRLAGWGGTTALVVAYAVACYSPTQVRVDVTTDVPCMSPAPDNRPIRTAFYVGAVLDSAAELVTDTTSCTPAARNRIGDLVFIPHDDRDARVTVHVVMNSRGLDPIECVQPDRVPEHCVIARRTFRYREHDTRTLPISLDQACLGQYCVPGTTCVGGSCTTDDVDQATFVDDAAAIDGAKESGGNTKEDAGPDGSVTGCATAPTDLAVLPAPSPRLAANATTLFYLSAGAGPARVEGIPHGGGKAKVYVPSFTGSLTALAADDTQLFVGTTSSLVHVALATGTVSSIDFGVAADIAIHQGIAFISRASAVGPGASFALYRYAPPIAPEQLLTPIGGNIIPGGEAIATGTDVLFVLSRTELDGSISAYPLPWTGVASAKDSAVKGGYDLAAWVRPGNAMTTAFVTTTNSGALPSASIQRWAVNEPTPVTHASGFTAPREIVADTTGLYHVATIPSGGPTVWKTVFGPGGGPSGLPSVSMEPSRYDTIDAIALGPTCVYIAAQRTKTAVPTSVIRGIPKTKVAGTSDSGITPDL